MVAILDAQPPRPLQLEERLVDERGGVEQHMPAATRKARARKTAQLPVELRGQAIEVGRGFGHREIVRAVRNRGKSAFNPLSASRKGRPNPKTSFRRIHGYRYH